MEKIIFDTVHFYNTLETGITIPISLYFGKNSVDFKAKIDTGSTHCIFERIHGENLGLDIESGFVKVSALLPEVLLHMDITS